MESTFTALLALLKVPLRPERGVKTDNSILVIYPPAKELDFREFLLDTVVPALQAGNIPFRLLDLSGFLFSKLSDDAIKALQEDEFEDYRWMQQGLSKRAETALQERLTELATEVRESVLVYGTVALYPLVRYGEVLRALRDLEARIVLAFPGEERGGRLHFMNQQDGGNYLAVKLFWR